MIETRKAAPTAISFTISNFVPARLPGRRALSFIIYASFSTGTASLSLLLSARLGLLQVSGHIAHADIRAFAADITRSRHADFRYFMPTLFLRRARKRAARYQPRGFGLIASAYRLLRRATYFRRKAMRIAPGLSYQYRRRPPPAFTIIYFAIVSPRRRFHGRLGHAYCVRAPRHDDALPSLAARRPAA